MMTKDEWLKWYTEHGGNEDLELHPDEIVYYHPEHGILSLLKHDDILEIHHMIGDGKYWFRLIKSYMKYYKLKTLRAFTKRNPKAWMRKYGGKIRGYYMEAGFDELKEVVTKWAAADQTIQEYH